MKKRQQKLNETIKKKKIKKILNDLNRKRILNESNYTFLRNRSSEHGIFFGKVIYHKDYVKNNIVANNKFIDEESSFKNFSNFDKE